MIEKVWLASLALTENHLDRRFDGNWTNIHATRDGAWMLFLEKISLYGFADLIPEIRRIEAETQTEISSEGEAKMDSRVVGWNFVRHSVIFP